jgi:predicted ribosome quality control (RQC) complex YloA/Tae2 family protein
MVQSWAELLSGLEAWIGARVQKAAVRETDEVQLELYRGDVGKQAITLAPGAGQLWMGPARGEAPPRPKGAQGLLRKELDRASLSAVEEEGGAVVLAFETRKGPRQLALERDPRDARLVILGPERKVLYVLGKVRGADGRDLRRGQTWTAPAGDHVAAPVEAASAPRKADVGLKALGRERKRVARLVKNLERDLARHGDPAALAQAGERLKLVLHEVKRGMKRVRSFDDEGAPVELELDPALDGAGNLERLFHRARRARQARERARPRLEEARDRLAGLDELRARIDEGDESARTELDIVLAARPDIGGGQRRRAATGPRLPYRAFRVEGDLVVKVGRSARDSDSTTFGHARGEDLWLHARDTTGAHVIVPSAKKREPPERALLDAALLAVWFSNRKGETWPVQITRRKHLTKPKGAPAGLVFVHDERVITVAPDEARLKRLLASEQ